MPIVKQTVLVCDICGRCSKPSNSSKLEGWVQWSQDHPVAEREWIERCACPSCIKDITDSIKRVN